MNNNKSAKVQREDTRAANVIARERARQARRQNKLPPFLMVRSGLLNGWIVTMLALLGAASTGNHFKGNILCDIASGIVAFSGVCYGIISTERKYKIFKQDIETIRDEFKRYIEDKNYSIYLAGKIHSPKLAKILIRHIAAHNPYIFDKMIDDPNSVTDFDTQSHIAAGYLRKYPAEAQRFINVCDSNQIDPKVFNMAQTYATRLKNFEQGK